MLKKFWKWRFSLTHFLNSNFYRRPIWSLSLSSFFFSFSSFFFVSSSSSLWSQNILILFKKLNIYKFVPFYDTFYILFAMIFKTKIVKRLIPFYMNSLIHYWYFMIQWIIPNIQFSTKNRTRVSVRNFTEWLGQITGLKKRYVI